MGFEPLTLPLLDRRYNHLAIFTYMICSNIFNNYKSTYFEWWNTYALYAASSVY